MPHDTIWKFQLDMIDQQTVIMPDSSEILSVGPQDDTVCLWAKVVSGAAKSGRKIHIFGTGHPLPDIPSMKFIGTVALFRDSLIFHVFDGGYINKETI